MTLAPSRRGKRPGPRLSIIPAAAVKDDRIDGQAVRVLSLLGCHTNKDGWCRRSQTTMAVELGCSRSSIQRALEQLIEAGYIERIAGGRPSRDADPEKHPFAAYHYRVLLDPPPPVDVALLDADDDDDELAEIDTVVPAGGHGVVPTGGHPVPISGAPYNERLSSKRLEQTELPLQTDVTSERASEARSEAPTGPSGWTTYRDAVVKALDRDGHGELLFEDFLARTTLEIDGSECVITATNLFRRNYIETRLIKFLVPVLQRDIRVELARKVTQQEPANPPHWVGQ